MKKLASILIGLLIASKVLAQEPPAPPIPPIPPVPSSSSTSSPDVILPPGISGKKSAVTLLPVSYEFIVTVTGPWHLYDDSNTMGFEYKTYTAICPAGSTLVRGPSKDDLDKLAQCTCNPTFCRSPYTENIRKGLVRTQAVCLLDNVYSYVLTSSLSSSVASGNITILGTTTIKGNPDAAHPFVYPFNDALSGPVLQKNDSTYNPIPTVDPLKGANFNSGAKYYTHYGDFGGLSPCK